MERFARSLIPSWCRVALALIALSGGTARGADRYFVIIFGSQKSPNAPRLAHSFATFIKVTGQPPHPCLVEHHTISWLPETLDVHLSRLRPEAGCNLDLVSTLRLAVSQGACVVRWGPYPIQPDLYDKAVAHIAHLNGDNVQYKAIDSGYSTARASNCMHAISDLADRPRLRIASPGWGHFASWAITCKLRPWMLDTTGDYEWVFDALEVCEHPIERRELDVNPRTSLSPAHRLLPPVRSWKR